MGGIFAGGSGSAFGSRSGNVLTRATTVLGALFLVLSLSLALLNRGEGTGGVEAEVRRQNADTGAGGWLEREFDSPEAEMPEEPADSGTAGLGTAE